jgi:hypothetical protein
MNNKEQELRAMYSEYSYEALRNIVYLSEAGCKDYALAAARAELLERHETLFATGAASLSKAS